VALNPNLIPTRRSGAVNHFQELVRLFPRRIEGGYFNVVGLLLIRLRQALTDLGWSGD